MGITFEAEPVRAIAKQLADGSWLVACRCPQRGLWGWDRLPEQRVVPCPCDGCPFEVRVVPMQIVVIRGEGDGERGT